MEKFDFEYTTTSHKIDIIITLFMLQYLHNINKRINRLGIIFFSVYAIACIIVWVYCSYSGNVMPLPAVAGIQ